VLPLLTKVDPSPSLDVCGEDRLSSLSSLCIQKPENRAVPGMDIAQTKKYALQKSPSAGFDFLQKTNTKKELGITTFDLTALYLLTYFPPFAFKSKYTFPNDMH
jgi:hypothetical protein